MVAFITSPIDTHLQPAARAPVPSRICNAVTQQPLSSTARSHLRETKPTKNTLRSPRSEEPTRCVRGLSGFCSVDIYISAIERAGNQEVLTGDEPIVPSNEMCLDLADAATNTTQQRFETWIAFVPQGLLYRWGKREFGQECLCTKILVPGILGIYLRRDMIHRKCVNKYKGVS